jgi:hypothetical protein
MLGKRSSHGLAGTETDGGGIEYWRIADQRLSNWSMVAVEAHEEQVQGRAC